MAWLSSKLKFGGLSYPEIGPKKSAWPKSHVCVSWIMDSFLEEVATKWTAYNKSDETCLERQIWSEVKTIFMFETKTFQNLCVVQLILAKNPCSIMVTGGLVNGNQYERSKEVLTSFWAGMTFRRRKSLKLIWNDFMLIFTGVQATSL